MLEHFQVQQRDLSWFEIPQRKSISVLSVLGWKFVLRHLSCQPFFSFGNCSIDSRTTKQRPAIDRRDKFRRFTANLKTFLSLPRDEVKGLRRFWPVHRTLEDEYWEILAFWKVEFWFDNEYLACYLIIPCAPTHQRSQTFCCQTIYVTTFTANEFISRVHSRLQSQILGNFARGPRKKKEMRATIVHRAVCGSSMDEESIIVHRNGVCCFMLRSSTQPPISTAIHFLQIEYFLLMSQFYGVFFVRQSNLLFMAIDGLFAVRRSLILIRQL